MRVQYPLCVFRQSSWLSFLFEQIVLKMKRWCLWHKQNQIRNVEVNNNDYERIILPSLRKSCILRLSFWNYPNLLVPKRQTRREK